MAKGALFTLKLEPALRADFMAEAVAADRPASQIVREMMRGFVKRQRAARVRQAKVRMDVQQAPVSPRLARARQGRTLRKPS